MHYRCKKCRHEFESNAQEVRCKRIKCRSRKVIQISQPIFESVKHAASPVKTTDSSEEDQQDGSLMDITFDRMLHNCGMNRGRIELISHIFFSGNPYDLRRLNDLLATAQVSESSRNLMLRYWATIVDRCIPDELMTDHEKMKAGITRRDKEDIKIEEIFDTTEMEDCIKFIQEMQRYGMTMNFFKNPQYSPTQYYYHTQMTDQQKMLVLMMFMQMQNR